MKNPIELSIWTTDGCALLRIRIGVRAWQSIQSGGEFFKSSYMYGELGRQFVSWSFKGGLFSIDGDDGWEHIIDLPISELDVTDLRDEASSSLKSSGV
jgi:hypothetical protein